MDSSLLDIFIVFMFSVTISPIAPSPLVTPFTKEPLR